MRTITKNAILIASASLILGSSLQAQWRWNPNDWKTLHESSGATTRVSEDNKTFIVTPYAHSTTDATARRGDIQFTRNVVLSESEPVVAVYMQYKDINMVLNDWKFDYIVQQRTAIAYDEGTQAYTWGPNDFSFGGRKDRISALQGVSAMCYTSDGADDLWIFDMTAGAPFEDAWLGNGDRNVPYAPTWITTEGQGVGEKQMRSWLGFVCIGNGAGANPTFNLKYCATHESVNDVFGNIENYLNSEGGREVRDGEETSVRNISYDKAVIFSGEGHVISPNAVRMTAYSVSGCLVKEVASDRMDLAQGIYIVKVTNGAGVVSVGKANVR